MRPDLKALRQLSDLDRLLDDSAHRPVVLFKHSYSCGTSAEALDELIAHLDQGRRGDADYAVVTVQTHREISNAVSARLGVRHETPQALLIRNGRVLWSASHFRVTADAVAKALDKHT
jgi:bacillithiol system protein YtxJ